MKTKKHITNLMTGLSAILLISCSDSEYNLDKLFPEQYHKVLAFHIESDKAELSLSTVQKDYQYTIQIAKGGSDPSLQAEADIEIMDQRMVDSLYSKVENIDYQVLPSDCYFFNDGQKMNFESNEKIRNVNITIHPEKIYPLEKLNPTTKYVLPLQLTSEKTSVTKDKSMLMVVLSVFSPTIGFSGNRDEQMVYKQLDLKLNVNLNHIDDNLWNFSCNIDPTVINQQTVDQYNTEHATDYELLPSEAYKLNGFDFSKGRLESSSPITIHREYLQNDHVYVLPLKLKAIEVEELKGQIDVADTISYLVVANPKYSYTVPDRSDWKILFCNEDNRFEGSEEDSRQGAPTIIDNDIYTYWTYARSPQWYWNTTYYPDGDDYNYDFKEYHALMGARRDTQIIVIDMKESRHVMGIGIIQRQDLARILKTAEFQVSDDEEFKFVPMKEGGDVADYNKVALNHWEYLFKYDDIPVQKELSWRRFTDSELEEEGKLDKIKGRFLKFEPRKGNVGSYNHGSCLAELLVMQLVAVDGEAVD